MKCKSLFLMASLFFVMAGPALAHRINIFALDEGGTVYTESTFAGKRPVKKGTVRVFNQAKALLLTGETNEKGIYTFARPDSGMLTVEVDAGMGHKNSWELEAVEGTVHLEAPVGDTVHPVEAPMTPMTPMSGLSPSDWKKMEAVVETAVTLSLHHAKAETRLQDIVGGFGYIVGLLGIALWFRSRKGEA